MEAGALSGNREVHDFTAALGAKLSAAGGGVEFDEFAEDEMLGKKRWFDARLKLIPRQMRVAVIGAEGELLGVFFGDVLDQLLIEHRAKAIAQEVLAEELILHLPAGAKKPDDAPFAETFEHDAGGDNQTHSTAAKAVSGHGLHFADGTGLGIDDWIPSAQFIVGDAYPDSFADGKIIQPSLVKVLRVAAEESHDHLLAFGLFDPARKTARLGEGDEFLTLRFIGGLIVQGGDQTGELAVFIGQQQKRHLGAERNVAQIGLRPAILHDRIGRHREIYQLALLCADLAGPMNKVRTDEFAAHGIP